MPRAADAQEEHARLAIVLRGMHSRLHEDRAHVVRRGLQRRAPPFAGDLRRRGTGEEARDGEKEHDAPHDTHLFFVRS
jgi:hypothetical protein